MTTEIASLRRAIPCLAAMSLSAGAAAGPADYVFVPYTEVGQRRFEYAAGVEQSPSGGRESEQAVSLGWTPVSRWFTSVYAGWYAEPDEKPGFYAWSWLNNLQLTTPGEGPVDAGLLCNFEWPRDRAEGTGVTCGASLQFDSERLQFNFNPLFEGYVGAKSPSATVFKYQWQVKGLWRAGLELGAQGFGEVGPWDHWLPASQQEHKLGPAIFAKWRLDGGNALLLDAAWLFGVGAASPDNTVRLRLQCEF